MVALALLETPAAAAPVPIQELNDATTSWLRATLHAHVDDRTVIVTDSMEPQNLGQYEIATRAVSIRPGLVAGLAVPVSVGGARFVDPDAPMILVHEALHRWETNPCWRDNADEALGASGDEEGIVQALTLDLLPAWGMRFWGSSLGLVGFGMSYPVDVARVRAYSRFGSGSTSWRDRAARLWRRDFWKAGCERRDALVAEASAASRAS